MVLRGQFDDVVMLWSDQKFGTPHTTPTQPQSTNRKSPRDCGNSTKVAYKAFNFKLDHRVDAIDNVLPGQVSTSETSRWPL
ncbi:hypothetical protein A1F94_013314 [Pyrenophora tritici-repentis]|nr:hypothetical protein A1F94_013314 [Pyrenophora tritici-repentis]KAI0590255.1 hypothetical protein Alg130_02476 [Pyrenophora tritici-repentis]KAI1545568.1 hypothetical protein PtrSN001A_002315 [Pyrenophora tritici-repentis]KAI1594841.1 hypothetical protein PtrEW13061_002313 [Pyrenophora tritici-repentis]PZD42190.1 hypothetical protein A1F97_03800 [Pyrenophora tritici-repentis]